MKLSLSNQEKAVLYRKYKTEEGLDSFRANEKVKKMNKHLRDIVLSLRRNKKLTPKQLKEKFDEEFYKLIEG